MIGFDDLQEAITIVHPPDRDEWGDDVPGTSSETDVERALFAPGATRELEVNANQVQADGTVFVEPDVAVDAHDRLRIRGEEYFVAGKPRLWHNTLTEIPVRLVTG